MLRELQIRDVAIIDSIQLRFAPGFNVLTGETGAGKSIIMQAITTLCGGRASTDLVRADRDDATIEGLFESDVETRDYLVEAGLPAGDDLLVRRVISRSGRNRITINGSLANLTVLEQIGRRLVHVYGQHEQGLLLRPESHLELLDAYAGIEEVRERMATQSAALEEQLAKREALEHARDTAAQRTELLRFQHDELSRAELEVGEDERLQREREILVHAERLAQICQQGEEQLYSGDNALASRVARLGTQLREAARIDVAFGEFAEMLDTAHTHLVEVAHGLRGYGDKIAFDPARRDVIEERLALLGRLKRKYGGSIESTLDTLSACSEELARMASSETDLEGCSREVQARAAAAWATASVLSRRRREAAKRLERDVGRELASLGMAGAGVSAVFASGEIGSAFDPRDPRSSGATRLGRTGADVVEFHLASNPGEPPRPLARIASGGELSRIMLALKVLTAGSGSGATLIFDEVDAGIGGQVADAVGERLRNLALQRQVLCITHLPQIAARGEHHFAVAKGRQGGRTVSMARALEGEARVLELGRMLGGRDDDEALRFARRLLEAAGPVPRRGRARSTGA